MTSYLGMNSIDIRNGAFTQARFWELSVPLTALVLAIVWGVVKFKRGLRRGVMACLGRFARRLRIRRKKAMEMDHEGKSSSKEKSMMGIKNGRETWFSK